MIILPPLPSDNETDKEPSVTIEEESLTKDSSDAAATTASPKDPVTTEAIEAETPTPDAIITEQDKEGSKSPDLSKEHAKKEDEPGKEKSEASATDGAKPDGDEVKAADTKTTKEVIEDGKKVDEKVEEKTSVSKEEVKTGEKTAVIDVDDDVKLVESKSPVSSEKSSGSGKDAKKVHAHAYPIIMFEGILSFNRWM